MTILSAAVVGKNDVAGLMKVFARSLKYICLVPAWFVQTGATAAGIASIKDFIGVAWLRAQAFPSARPMMFQKTPFVL